MGRSMPPASASSTYFATVADSYDRLQPVLSPPYGPGLDMLVALIPFAKDEKFEFVELGCGTGEPSRKVLEHFPRGARNLRG